MGRPAPLLPPGFGPCRGGREAAAWPQPRAALARPLWIHHYPRRMGKMPGGRGAPPDMRKLMQAAQQMQAHMQQAQADLAEREFEGSTGGGVVKAIATGEGKLLSVDFDPSVLDPDDPDLVGDLVVAAVNQANEAAQTATAEAMGGVAGLDAGGLGGLGGLLGG